MEPISSADNLAQIRLSMDNIFDKTLLQLNQRGEQDAEFIPLITSEEEESMNKQEFKDELPILSLRNNVLFLGL